MESHWSAEEIQERMRESGELLLKLSESPDTLAELRGALDAFDLQRFREALDRGLGGFAPPGDKCDPYVRVFITILKPPKYVRRCEWVFKRLEQDGGEQLANAVSAGISAEDLTDLLEAIGLLRCWWEPESQDEILEVNKFVQGVCPPGTF
jgi:hypothetical protein